MCEGVCVCVGVCVCRCVRVCVCVFLTDVGLLLAVGDLAIELVGRHLHVGVGLVNGHSQVFLDISKVLEQDTEVRRH